MDILQQELNRNKNLNTKSSKSKKIVLVLLVISIALFILALAGMFLLKGTPQKRTLLLSIDGNDINVNNDLIITLNEKSYISIENISKPLGFNYTRGGYLEYTEDNSKCYLENQNQIIGFEADSNQIFKTTENTTTDYQYYELNNKILSNNNMLYIALEDLGVGLNVIYNYSDKENKITIDTLDYQIGLVTEKAKQNSLEISTQKFENKQALIYGIYVVTGNNRKMGLVDKKLETLVGNRYDTIEFNEFTQKFIVSDDGKYGIIDKTGKQLVRLKYESIEIINYSPLLYKVKEDGKYGLLDENGQEILYTEYNSIGVNNSGENGNILIIEDINKQKEDGIVVNKDGKYGIMNVKTGEQILECTLDRIFTKKENGKFVYYVRVNNTEITLERYLELSNTVVVNVPQNNEQNQEEQQEAHNEQQQENQENEQQNEEEQQENEQENYEE